VAGHVDLGGLSVVDEPWVKELEDGVFGVALGLPWDCILLSVSDSRA
jgi:hypothetical protein